MRRALKLSVTKPGLVPARDAGICGRPLSISGLYMRIQNSAANPIGTAT